MNINLSSDRSFGILLAVIFLIVHLVYYNATENLSVTQVQSQIDILNNQFIVKIFINILEMQ